MKGGYLEEGGGGAESSGLCLLGIGGEERGEGYVISDYSEEEKKMEWFKWQLRRGGKGGGEESGYLFTIEGGEPRREGLWTTNFVVP